MKRRHGRIGTVLIAVVLVATALAGGALAAIMAQRTTAVNKIRVKEVNYRIKLTKHTFPKGKTTFIVHNASISVHEFKVKGPGVTKRIPGTIAPGATKKLTVTLRKGTYTLSCPLHLSLGMKTTIKAGGAAAGGTTTGGGSGGWG
jgi:iron uptake system component EfeO